MALCIKQKFLQTYVTLFVFYLASVTGIKVKFGTNDGPIVPPTPFPPTPPPQPPYRVPAAVWEDQSGDIPNPNPYKPPVPPQLAHIFGTKPTTTQETPSSNRPWNPHRYTHIVYTPKKPVIVPQQPSSTVSPVKSFVNAYAQPTKPTPEQQNSEQRHVDNVYKNDNDNRLTFASYNIVPELGIKYVPGFGFKYITPDQDKDIRKYQKTSKYSHDKYNAIETNELFGNNDHQNDIDLSYDKYVTQRVKKSPEQQVYVPRQTFSYYHQPQLFFPVNYARH